jgi:hypothetical protein
MGFMGLTRFFPLPANGRGEYVVGFQEGCEGEEDQHDGGGPAEELQWEGGGVGGGGVRFGFAEDVGADEGDAGREGQEEKRVDDAVANGLVGLEEELGVFEGEEDGVEDSEEGEEAEEESYGFGEFEQHAPAPLVVYCTAIRSNLLGRQRG